MRFLQCSYTHGVLAIVAITAMLSASPASASVIYNYVGNTFTEEIGSTFTTADKITGFVEFGTEPTAAGHFDTSDVADFSFSAGPLTITDATDIFKFFSFDFDSNPTPQIINWAFFVQLAIDTDLQSCAPGTDFNCLVTETRDVANDASSPLSSAANFDTAGTWTRSPSPVPLPAALPLFLSALAGLGLMGWRRRQAGA